MFSWERKHFLAAVTTRACVNLDTPVCVSRQSHLSFTEHTRTFVSSSQPARITSSVKKVMVLMCLANWIVLHTCAPAKRMGP